MNRGLALPWEGWPACPCGCGKEGTKLAFKSGHLARLCTCISCRNRANRNRGQRAEARRHRVLGGVGFTPNDELATSYSINVTTQDKAAGKHIPASFRDFIGSEKARHWFRQAEKKVPVGSDARPTLYLELGPKDAYLVVRLGSKELRS